MYDLIDDESANLIDWFDSRAAALAAVRETIVAAGRAAVAGWVLVSSDATEAPLRGAELAEQALKGVAA